MPSTAFGAGHKVKDCREYGAVGKGCILRVRGRGIVDQADAEETWAVLSKVKDRSAILLYKIILCVKGLGEGYYLYQLNNTSKLYPRARNTYSIVCSLG